MKRSYVLMGLALIAAVALGSTAIAGGGLAVTSAKKKVKRGPPGPPGTAGPAGALGATGATGATGPSNAQIERDANISVPDSIAPMQSQTVQGGSPYLFWAKARMTNTVSPTNVNCDLRAGGTEQDSIGSTPVPLGSA